jgi:hypothetical protein
MGSGRRHLHADGGPYNGPPVDPDADGRCVNYFATADGPQERGKLRASCAGAGEPAQAIDRAIEPGV